MERGVTARRACRIVGISTARPYRAPAPDKDAALKERLRCVWRPNMGYRMAHALVKEGFAPLNVKRVHRIWKLEKLGRMKRYRKRRTGAQIPLCATAANEVWTVDFVHDSCLNGTKLKILSVVDEFTRECLALEVATRLDSQALRSVLALLIEDRGAPRFVRSDNGPEFIARTVAVFLSEAGAGSHFIQPGKPWQNAYVESFHSTLRRDHLDVEVFVNLADAQVKTAVYRRYYNEVRPHSSLGNRPPAVAARDASSGRATPSLRSHLDLSLLSTRKDYS